MTEALASLYSLSRGTPPLTREQAELFHAQAQTGNWRRKLTASGGASGFRNFREPLTFLPNIHELTRV